MARGGFSRRRGGLSTRTIGIIVAVVIVAAVGAVFWFSGQAESRKPEQTEITVEATNVGPH